MVVLFPKDLDDFELVKQESIKAITKSEKKYQDQYGHGCRVGGRLAVMETGELDARPLWNECSRMALKRRLRKPEAATY